MLRRFKVPQTYVFGTKDWFADQKHILNEIFQRFSDTKLLAIRSSAIDEDGTLLDFDHEELIVTQAIYKQSRKVILIADANKFDRKAPYVTGSLSDIDIFVTDLQPSKKIIKLCRSNNIDLIITSPQGK